MANEKSITVWHFEDGGEKVSKNFFYGVKFRHKNKIDKSGIKEKGMHRADSAVIRIMTRDRLNISCGDYVQEGEQMGEMPDYRYALKVTGISDNRIGSTAHWKLSCGG